MAKEIEKIGVNIMGIKDMAALLKPYAAITYKALKKCKYFQFIFIHMILVVMELQRLMAADAGVDIVDMHLQQWQDLQVNQH